MGTSITYIFVCLTFLMSVNSHAQTQQINDFIVKEGLTSNGKIAIIAIDSLQQANEHINGTFKFSINGFEQSLQFRDGVGIPSHPIDGSTFVYFKHKNKDQSNGRFYFLLKKDNKITPIKVNGLLLLMIPCLLLLVAYAFKRLITTFIILLIIYGYFFYDKGLSISQLLESAYQTIFSFF